MWFVHHERANIGNTNGTIRYIQIIVPWFILFEQWDRNMAISPPAENTNKFGIDRMSNAMDKLTEHDLGEKPLCFRPFFHWDHRGSSCCGGSGVLVVSTGRNW
jgi:hypothetical protein